MCGANGQILRLKFENILGPLTCRHNIYFIRNTVWELLVIEEHPSANIISSNTPFFLDMEKDADYKNCLPIYLALSAKLCICSSLRPLTKMFIAGNISFTFSEKLVCSTEAELAPRVLKKLWPRQEGQIVKLSRIIWHIIHIMWGDMAQEIQNRNPIKPILTKMFGVKLYISNLPTWENLNYKWITKEPRMVFADTMEWGHCLYIKLSNRFPNPLARELGNLTSD